MNGTSEFSDIYFPSRMVGRDMCEGECYDVQMVRMRFIIEDVLDFPLDRAKAKEICESCEYNQLNSPDVSDRSKK
ncbi:MAG: hypothetical protein FWE82_07305 [Defluviitaleaceae bacterium]|nr:hypothetical protein [Defluviitaleaceae bacterium]